VPFQDFNAQGFELDETPPGPGVRGEHIRWFWEPAHYTAELGEAMLILMRNNSIRDTWGDSHVGAGNVEK